MLLIKKVILLILDFIEAYDSLYMGTFKSNAHVNKLELYKTAVHESGHALISLLKPSSVMELYKITILKRGNSLGHNMSIFLKENEDVDKEFLLNQIDCLLGGRAAEEIVFGNNFVTTGISI